jgi:opacity protein-like surface antigen
LAPAVLFSGPALAVESELGAEVYYFDPTNDVLREFYKPGMVYGLDGRLWFDNGFGLGSDLGWFSRTRTYAGEDFNLTAYWLELSMMYSLKGSNWMRPYFGAGVSVQYSIEKNVNGAATVNNTTVGYQVDTGLEFKLKWFRPYVQVSYRDVPSGAEKIDLSGWMAGVGFQFLIPTGKKMPPSAQGVEP